MANAMVIGIGGVGSVIGQKLHEFECFDRIVLPDIEPVFAEQLASRMPRHRFVVVQVNAMDTERLAPHQGTESGGVVNIWKSLQLLNLDTWKKVKVDGVEVSPVRVASANLPKPAQLGATVDGYSCVGTEVRGTKDRRRVEYFVYTMDSHRDTYERYGYSLTLVQTGIPPALTARLLSPERFASAES
jgi:saccharopine dehydrogenase-like NADP-dependent oxidoreductase